MLTKSQASKKRIGKAVKDKRIQRESDLFINLPVPGSNRLRFIGMKKSIIISATTTEAIAPRAGNSDTFAGAAEAMNIPGINNGIKTTGKIFNEFRRSFLSVTADMASAEIVGAKTPICDINQR